MKKQWHSILIEQKRLPIFLKGIQENWLSPTSGNIEHIDREEHGYLVTYWENRERVTMPTSSVDTEELVQ